MKVTTRETQETTSTAISGDQRSALVSLISLLSLIKSFQFNYKIIIGWLMAINQLTVKTLNIWHTFRLQPRKRSTLSLHVRRQMDIGMEFDARILQFKCNYASIAIAHCLRCEEDFKWQESVASNTCTAQTDRHTITSTSIWTNVRDFAL